jgi:hypothetical protein
MIEKPIAWLSKHDFAVTDEGEELCDSLNETESINLFTESQLKAERESAIRECAAICSNIPHDNGITEPCFTNACESEILKLLDN